MTRYLFMKARRYLEDVLAGRDAVRIARVLVRRSGLALTIRELAREARVWPSAAQLIVHRFTQLGLLGTRQVGRAHLIEVNGDHYLFREVLQPIIQAEYATLERMRKRIAAALPSAGVVSAAIFGSYARGEETHRSDLDLLVVTRDGQRMLPRLDPVRNAMVREFGCGVSPYVVTEARFRSRAERDAFFRTILERYVMVHGRDLRELTGLA